MSENQIVQPQTEQSQQTTSEVKQKQKRKFTYSKQGRPTPFDTLKIEQVKKLILKGFSDSEIAQFIGVTPVTYYSWKSKHKSFFSEIEVFKKQQNANVRRSLYERALGYSHEAIKFFVIKGKIVGQKFIEHYPPDTEACKFWLKNKESEEWRDKQELEHTGDITITNLVAEVETKNRLSTCQN